MDLQTLPQPTALREPAFHSEWSDPIGGGVPDIVKHAAFVAYARLVAANTVPWLLPLLAESGARVLLGRGIFQFDLPSRPGEWCPVPQLEALLQLHPWADPGEPSH